MSAFELILAAEKRRNHWRARNVATGTVYIFPDTENQHPAMPDGQYVTTKIATSGKGKVT